jgi:hypothetical protein
VFVTKINAAGSAKVYSTYREHEHRLTQGTNVPSLNLSRGLERLRPLSTDRQPAGSEDYRAAHHRAKQAATNYLAALAATTLGLMRSRDVADR